MTFNEDFYLPGLVCWQLNYAPWVLNQIEQGSQGGIMEAISSTVLRKIIFPVPPSSEQHIIHERYQNMQKTLRAESSQLEKRRALKTGLMQDLLTGKVRVNVDEVEEVLADV